jgi:uncharacterized protein YjbI with pentapeptide repeats
MILNNGSQRQCAEAGYNQVHTAGVSAALAASDLNQQMLHMQLAAAVAGGQPSLNIHQLTQQLSQQQLSQQQLSQQQLSQQQLSQQQLSQQQLNQQQLNQQQLSQQQQQQLGQQQLPASWLVRSAVLQQQQLQRQQRRRNSLGSLPLVGSFGSALEPVLEETQVTQVTHVTAAMQQERLVLADIEQQLQQLLQVGQRWEFWGTCCITC